MSVPAKAPKRLGPYEVGQKIGGGGMATVYLGRAWDARGVERVVALKVIKDELLNDTRFVNMFLDEANILTRLSHPNIIETLEFGISDAHRYIAMELLLGRTLAEVWDAGVEQGKVMDASIAAWICARIADALHAAHELTNEAGEPLLLIHRDANPTNIFLTYDGRVKLIDFGLAKSIGRKAKSSQGIVKGKVPYLSPEQVSEKEIDRRSDIFTLGATLWEITTGKRLFKRANDVDTIRAILKGQTPDPVELFPLYPPELSRILRNALHPDRELRYPTAAKMAKDLDAFVAKKGTSDMQDRVRALLVALFPADAGEQIKGSREATARWLARGLLPRKR